MLELTYANLTEALLDRLVARLQAQRAQDPWESIHLVVPGPFLKEYLRAALARRLGLAANLRFSYLGGLWRELLKDTQVALLDGSLLRAGVLAVLGDPEVLGCSDLAPVRSFLGGGADGVKRIQLAGELGRLFEEYQLSRPDWIEAWRRGDRAGVADAAAERWQSRLWREAVGRLDAARPEGARPSLTLPELVRQGGLQQLEFPSSLHAFGLSHVAQAYHEVYRAFGRLSRTTLHLYALNPCGEFWEDLSTDQEALWRRRPRRSDARTGTAPERPDDPYDLASEGPRALRLWGRPGRENVRLLNEVSDCDFHSAFRVPSGNSLLERLQRDLVLFREPEEGTDLGPDSSIRLLACASPRREAEAVASGIWGLLEAHAQTDRPLSFSDIAVVIPPKDREATFTHLVAAFQDTRRIPLVQAGGALPVLGQLLEVVDLLLDLPTSGMTRAALLRVLQHPALRRRVPELDVDVWARWCAALGIVRGADRAAWDGTYLDQDALSWDQGLKRLALGAVLAEGAELSVGDLTYAVPTAKEPEAAAAFTALARGLLQDGEALRTRQMDPRAWMQHLWAFFQRWLEVDAGEDGEAVLKALERIRTFLERTFASAPEGMNLPILDFPAARELAREALERLKGEQPASLARGVVVGTLAELRAIPFRAVFLLGLGEGTFPSGDRPSPLDLRGQARRPGDVSGLEKDAYLFLELLLSVRDHLVLSHVAVDELSGEPCEPSSLWKGFRRLLGAYLASGLASTEAGDPLVEVQPARRYDPSSCPGWFPRVDAVASWSAAAAREVLARSVLGDPARARGVALPRRLGDLHLAEPALATLRELLAVPAVPEGTKLPERLGIRLSDLRTFLTCPLTGAAAVRLGLRSRPLEDLARVEDEALATPALVTWSLTREVALEVLRAGGRVADAHRQAVWRLQAEGAAPFGLYAQVEAQAQLQAAQGWVDALEGGRPETWRLGPASQGRQGVDHPRPPLTVELPSLGRAVELWGDLRPQLGGSLFLEDGKDSPDKRPRLERKALTAWIDHVVLTLIQPGHGEHRARFIFARPSGGSQERVFVFPILTREAAQAQLGTWLEDLLTGDHAVLLPIEAVLEAEDPLALTAEDIHQAVEASQGRGRTPVSTLLGPVPDPLSYPPPPDPAAIVERRLGAFLRAIRAEECV